MAKYYMKEENLTSIADSIRNIYGKNDKMTCGDMVGDLNGAKTEVDEQSELIEKIASKFWDIVSIKIVDRTIKTFSGNYSYIRSFTFYKCASLTTINLPITTIIGGSAFRDCTALTSVNLPNVTLIQNYAFEYCTSLTSIDLPNVTSIGEGVFRNCKSLTSVDLPNVTSIDDNAFYDCDSLTSIDLPNVTSIGERVFWSCNRLTTLVIRTNTLCILKSNNAFDYTPIKSGTGYIYVPRTLIEDYKIAENWSTYASKFRAIEDYSDVCGEVSV